MRSRIRQIATFRFWRGDMTEEHLSHAEGLAEAGNNRRGSRSLYALRGEWRLGQGQYDLASESLHEAVRMARETVPAPEL